MKSKTLSAGKIPAFSLIAMILSIIACKQTAEFVQPELGVQNQSIS
jgi:hypothetical protein